MVAESASFKQHCRPKEVIIIYLLSTSLFARRQQQQIKVKAKHMQLTAE